MGMNSGLESLPADIELRERYDFNCAVCGYPMSAAPSLLMRSGLNEGCGNCRSCKAFLKLRINATNDGMISGLYEVPE